MLRTVVLLIGFRFRANVGLLHARTGGKCMPRYSLLDELTPVVFVPERVGLLVFYIAGIIF